MHAQGDRHITICNRYLPLHLTDCRIRNWTTQGRPFTSRAKLVIPNPELRPIVAYSQKQLELGVKSLDLTTACPIFTTRTHRRWPQTGPQYTMILILRTPDQEAHGNSELFVLLPLPTRFRAPSAQSTQVLLRAAGLHAGRDASSITRG